MISIGDAVLKITGNATDLYAELDKVKTATSKLSQVTRPVGMAMTAMGGAITGAMAMSTKSAIGFESAWAGVTKTVDASQEELATMRSELRDMAKELPNSHEELAGIAAAAGQLGIQTKNILGFTEVIAKLGMATNLAAEQGATELARFANITGMAQTEFENLGSALVALGNNLATTESEIVAMSMRLAGAGTTIGLTEPQILALAGSLSSVGIEAEAGGTAFSQMMLKMQSAVLGGGDALNTFAKVSGVSAEEFQKVWATDASQAIMMFIEGIGRMNDAGQDVTPVLEEVELSGIRLTDAILRASGATDLFRNAQELANQSWQENSALSKEAAARIGTTESQIAILKNTIKDLAISIGETLAPILKSIIDSIKPIIDSISNWVKNNPELAKTITIVVAAVGGLMVVLGPLVLMLPTIINSISMLSGVIKSVTAIQWLWNAAMTANPIGLIIAGIAALIAAGIALWKNWDKITNFFVEAWSTIKIAFATAVKFIVNTVLMPFIEFYSRVIGNMAKGVGKLVGIFNEDLGKSIENVSEQILNAREEITDWCENLIDAENVAKDARKAEKAIEELGETATETAQQTTEELKKQLEERKKQLKEQKNAALEGLKEERIAAQTEYEKRIQDIREDYGILEEEEEGYQETRIEAARKANDKLKEQYDKDIDNARDAYNVKIDLINKEYDAKLKLIDDETARIISGYQARIDAIEAEEEAEERAEKEAERATKLAELQKAVDTARTKGQRLDALEKLHEYEKELEKERLDEAREAEKNSLRQAIEDARNAAEEKRAQLEKERDAEIEHETILYKALMDRLEKEKEGLDAALEEEIARLVTERKEAEQAEKDKLDATLNALTAKENATKTYYDNQLTMIEQHVADVNAATSKIEARTVPITLAYDIPPMPPINLPGYQYGGVIPEPTLLYGLKSMRPYAIAGEKGKEYVTPSSGGGVVNNFTISELVVREDADVKRIAKELYRLQRSKEIAYGI